MRTRARAKERNTLLLRCDPFSHGRRNGNTFSRKADRFLRKVRYFHAKTPHFSPYHSVGEAIFFINTLQVHNAR